MSLPVNFLIGFLVVHGLSVGIDAILETGQVPLCRVRQKIEVNAEFTAFIVRYGSNKPFLA